MIVVSFITAACTWREINDDNEITEIRLHSLAVCRPPDSVDRRSGQVRAVGRMTTTHDEARHRYATVITIIVPFHLPIRLSVCSFVRHNDEQVFQTPTASLSMSTVRSAVAASATISSAAAAAAALNGSING